MAESHEEFVRSVRRLVDLIDIQGRGFTPAPKDRESRDDFASRDERDQVFGDELMRVTKLLEKAENDLPRHEVSIESWRTPTAG